MDLLPEMTISHLTELIQLGGIYINGVRQTGPIQAGDYLRVHLAPKRFRLPNCKPCDLIVFADGDFVVANKPAGLPTHATLDNAKENLVDFLRSEYGALYPAQRLDQGTSGLVTLARSAQAVRLFQNWQNHRLVTKIYIGVTDSAPPLGRHRHWQIGGKHTPHTAYVHEIPQGKISELEVLDVESLEGGRFKVKLQLLTGRTHQIRAQLSALGSPLSGDILYGSRHELKNGFCLTCVSLAMPTKDSPDPLLHIIPFLDPAD